MSGPRTLELFRHIDPMGDGLISAQEFYGGMKTLGFQGPLRVVMDLFTELDGEDGNNTIEYDQFSAWLLRSTSEAEFKARAYRSWKITETEEEAVRVQLSKLMKVRRVQPSHLLDVTLDVTPATLHLALRQRDWFTATDLFAVTCGYLRLLAVTCCCSATGSTRQTSSRRGRKTPTASCGSTSGSSG